MPTEESTTPSLLRKNTKDPLDCAWRMHMKDGQWVPDVAVSACMLCRVDFTFWNRKHHCRRCGAVVCYSCSLHRTKFIYKEVSPSHAAPEEARVCDVCIQVVDEKLAAQLNKKYNRVSEPYIGVTDNQEIEHEDVMLKQDKPLPISRRNSSRAILSTGSYRADIKESEGNRYIRDHDL